MGMKRDRIEGLSITRGRSESGLVGGKGWLGDEHENVIHSNILPAQRGIGTHSRMLLIPPTQPTSRSKPIPNPQ